MKEWRNGFDWKSRLLLGLKAERVAEGGPSASLAFFLLTRHGVFAVSMLREIKGAYKKM